MEIIQALRKYKIFGMAGFDLITTFIVSYLLGQKMNSQGILFTVLSIPVSIFIHKLFNVETKLTKEFDKLLI